MKCIDMIRWSSLLVVFFLSSCSTDALNIEETLNDSLASKRVVRDNVIACAASNANDDLVSVFFYPRPGATNIQYYETEDATFDKDNFENYVPVVFPLTDVFNGFLKKFDVSTDNEKWVIVAFDEGGETHLSNPIRLKQNSKPTEFLNQNVSIDASSDMPNFSWEDGSYSDTKIYFQVVSDDDNNLISGTYTFERMFQFYDLENVVLNITKSTPDMLQGSTDYNFTLMGVSEDNWVNLFSQKSFRIQ